MSDRLGAREVAKALFCGQEAVLEVLVLVEVLLLERAEAVQNSPRHSHGGAGHDAELAGSAAERMDGRQLPEDAVLREAAERKPDVLDETIRRVDELRSDNPYP